MQEISPHVYIETQYAGVTLGAVSWAHGLVLIDAPFRPDDVRSWRSALLNLGGGVDRLLITLDAHFDRTLGVRAMDSTVVAHEKVADIFRNRPVTFKMQGSETGADWELYNGLGSVRWAAPDLTFTESMEIHWDEHELVIESHPGPSTGACWVTLPMDGVAFIGDAVLAGQPPFLASADLPAWIDTLRLLLSPQYQDYSLVSGRGGMINVDQIQQQLHLLESIHAGLEKLAARKAPPEETAQLVPNILGQFPAPQPIEAHYQQRLLWGLQQYYARTYRQMAVEEE